LVTSNGFPFLFPCFDFLCLSEDARNAIDHDHSEFQVIGGYLSPVHNAYGKESLTTVTAEQRMEMCRLASQESDWIDVSEWEIAQSNWTRTVRVLEMFEKVLNEQYKDVLLSKLTPDQPTKDMLHIHVKLLAGADLLDSLRFEDIWPKDDRQPILEHFGVVCIEREGIDTKSLLESDPVISPHRERMITVGPACINTISSSSIR
jgi:nicotinamide mononucleotide adenylyltransferase